MQEVFFLNTYCFIEKRCNKHVTSTGQRNCPKQKLNLSPSVQRTDALTTQLRRIRGELGHIQGSSTTYVLRTAKISEMS